MNRGLLYLPCSPQAISCSHLSSGPSHLATLVKPCLCAFLLGGSFQNLPRLLVSRVVTPSGSVAASSHARRPFLCTWVRGSVGDSRRACSRKGGHSVWWPRVRALEPGLAQTCPLLVSDPRQGWALASLCVHGFFTAPNLGVDARGAQRTGAGTGGDEAVGQSLERAGKTSVPSLYSCLLSTHCVSGLVPCLHPQAFLASAPAAQPLDWLFPLPGGPTPYSIQQGQRGCAQACLVPGAVGEELPDSLRPCASPHTSEHCLNS